jgi:hypothetical protein
LLLEKRTFKTLLKKKASRQSKANNLRTQIDFNEKEIQTYESLINIVNMYLAEDAIPTFREEKMNKYFKMLEIF